MTGEITKTTGLKAKSHRDKEMRKKSEEESFTLFPPKNIFFKMIIDQLLLSQSSGLMVNIQALFDLFRRAKVSWMKSKFWNLFMYL